MLAILQYAPFENRLGEPHIFLRRQFPAWLWFFALVAFVLMTLLILYATAPEDLSNFTGMYGMLLSREGYGYRVVIYPNQLFVTYTCWNVRCHPTWIGLARPSGSEIILSYLPDDIDSPLQGLHQCRYYLGHRDEKVTLTSKNGSSKFCQTFERFAGR